MHPEHCPSVGLGANMYFGKPHPTTGLPSRDPSRILIPCSVGPIQAGWDALGPTALGFPGQESERSRDKCSRSLLRCVPSRCQG